MRQRAGVRRALPLENHERSRALRRQGLHPRVKVLHVATRHRLGGAERNLNHTVGWQLARGYDVHVAIGSDGFFPSLPDGTRVHLLEDLVRDVAPREDYAAFRQLQRLVRAERYDIVHTHQSKAGIVGRAAASGATPLILHTLHMASFGPAYGRTASEVFLKAERYAARFTDLFISVGRELAERYIRAGVGSPDRHVVIHSPIEVERFQQVREATNAQRLEWRKRFSARPDLSHVVSIGALDRRKRHHVVIDSLAPLLRAGEMTFTIAGDGPEATALANHAKTLGVSDAVRLSGFVSDVPALLGSADLLVHASELEGVPQSVIQALAAGVPVVATEMEGLGEIRDRVRCVDREGVGLKETAIEVLQAPDRWCQAPMDPYRAWCTPAIENAHEALFSAAEELLARRQDTGRPPGPDRPLANIVDLVPVGQPFSVVSQPESLRHGRKIPHARQNSPIGRPRRKTSRFGFKRGSRVDGI